MMIKEYKKIVLPHFSRPVFLILTLCQRGVILYLEVRESCTLYVFIDIFV